MILNFYLTATENFRVWHSSMTKSLKEKNKLEFFEDYVKKDSDDELNYSK